jgi:uncharacterized protein (TIGR02145 family)
LLKKKIAQKMKNTIYLFCLLAFLVSKSQAQTVTDYDGNIYNTVTIGTQVWTKENLNVKHYRNGDPITEIKDSVAWVNQKTGAWCYNENKPSNGPVYGTLYNWYAANDSRKIAPVGWHLPTDEEWKTLEMFLGMPKTTADMDQYRGTKEGNALKEPGTTTHWTLDCCSGHVPNAGTNSSGFTAFGGGFRWYFNAGIPYRSFSPPTGNAQFWTSTAPNDSTAWLRHLCVYHEDIFRANWKKTNGSSIRMVKDVTTGINEMNKNWEMKIYPNPATESIFISVQSNEKQQIQIFNAMGLLVKDISITHTMQIDITDLISGIYFVHLNNRLQHTQKFIKQ